MPKMNGWEFLEAYDKLNVRKKEHGIIIMLTTSLNPDDELKARAISEIDGFENKPLRADGLEKVLTTYFPDKT